MAAAVEIFDQALKVRLAKMIAANADARKLTATWAADLVGGVEDVLKAEGMPRWKALGELQKARRTAAGKWPGKMLQVTGKLADGVQPDSGADFAMATNNDVRAKTLHYGAKVGEFGRYSQTRVRKYAEGDYRRKAGTVTGFPIPWGNIPARPFMVIPAATRKVIVERGLKWVSGDGL